MANTFKPFGEWGISLKSNDKKTSFVGLRQQLVFRILALVAGTLVLCWIFNTLFMSYIYRQEKVQAMEETYTSLDTAVKDGTLYSNEYKYDLEQMALNNNLDIVVATYDGTVLLSSGQESNNAVNRLLNAVLSNSDGKKSLVNTNNYDVTIDTDAYVNDKYLILTGTFSDGNLIMIRYAMENINISIDIIDRTLIIVGIFSILVSVIIIEIFTRIITQPVYELTDISKKMTELDFDVKYSPRPKSNEIDTLGMHMNTMSEALETSLRELKKANVELKKDIEIKEKNEVMRKEFLSNVSHELKTPIALIQGYAEGLIDGMAEDPESRDYYCEVIVDEAQKMNKMVQQLMSLNELEYGKVHVNKSDFNLTEMIRGIAGASAILIEQGEINLDIQLQDEMIVNTDEFYLELVFTNLFSNAIHYCKNEKDIKVFYTESRDKVRVSVYNSGDNIPEEAITRLWDKFYKVDKARTREYGGSGVGLSIVKAAMETLEGTFGVYNTETGVTFWFEIYK